MTRLWIFSDLHQDWAGERVGPVAFREAKRARDPRVPRRDGAAEVVRYLER